MNTYAQIAVVSLLAPACLAAPDLQIRLTPTDAQATGVRLTFRGDEDGQTRVSLARDWGGTAISPDWFSALTATGDEGSLPWRYEHKPDALVVTHEPGETITLGYQIHGAPAYSDVDDYSPLATPQGVACFTANTIYLPDRWFGATPQDSASITAQVDWENLDARQWIHYPTLGDAGAPILAQRVREAILLAGSFRSAAFDHGDSAFHVVELGQNAAFTPGALASYAKPLLAGVQDYVGDPAPSAYLITYAPAGEPIEHGFAIGGTAVTNAFCLYFDPSVDITDNPGLADAVSYLVAHEYTHNWNGVLFWVEEPDYEHQSRWFIEGFTDFITHRAMLDAGVRDGDWYAHEMRSAHQSYNANPHRDLSNREAAPRWIQDHEVSDMLYKRGELIALLIDQRVRAQSDNTISLRDLIRELVREGKRGEASVPPERIMSWIEKHTDRDFRAHIEKLIEQGGAIPAPDAFTDPAP